MVDRGPYWPYNGYDKTTWHRNQSPGYNAEFHLYQLEWTPGIYKSTYLLLILQILNNIEIFCLDYLKFSLDNVELGTMTPTAGGFWELGGFPADVQNPWRYATKMAPFDEEVFSFELHFQIVLK